MGKITDETKKRKVKYIQTIRMRHIYAMLQFLGIGYLVYKQVILDYPEMLNDLSSLSKSLLSTYLTF